MDDITKPPLTEEELQKLIKLQNLAEEQAHLKMIESGLPHAKEIQSTTMADPNWKAASSASEYEADMAAKAARADRWNAIKARMRTPSSVQIDPSLLTNDIVRDIDIGAYHASKPLARLSKILGVAAKTAPVVGTALDVAMTPEVGEGSDIVPGRPTFDELYPKEQALRKLAGKHGNR